MKLVYVLGIIILLVISGCSLMQRKIDTGKDNCENIMTGLSGAIAGELVDLDCKNRCQVEGEDYDRWECSNKDTILCICK